MKSILLTLLTLLSSVFIFGVQAQETKTNTEKKTIQQTRTVNKGDSIRVIADSTVVEIKNDGEKKRVKIIFEYGKESIDKHLKDSIGRGIRSADQKNGYEAKEDKVFAGIIFARFDLGLAKMLDNGSLTLSPENEFLKHRSWKSVNVGFDVLQMGYKFTDQFKVKLAAGFDWTHFRLKEDILFLKDTKPLSYVESDVDYSKNRFSYSYLRIPLIFELKTKPKDSGKRITLEVGPVMGILLQGSQKTKDEEGKRKVKDGFNFAPVTYGGFARFGVGDFGVYTKYYFNDMFVNSPQQEGLKNLSFGFMLFF